MKVVIKVGTQSILANDGTPFEPIMRHLVEQIVALQKAGHYVVLVSSGAVGSGRKVARQYLGRQYGSSIGEKQVLAALGQHVLMNIYAVMFREHNLLTAQLLLTKQDFQTRQHYLNIARLLREILEHKNIIPIINENDSVAIEELMFTDNDELAGLIAAQMNADKLIILSNVEGVFTGQPNEPGAELIPIINPETNWPEVSAMKSTYGRGGMISKLGTARKMSSLGITTHIASINQPSAVMRIITQEQLGTTILPSKKKSNIKRWIAYSSDKQTGSISVNPGLFKILKENRRVISILPIGIENYRGNFKKGDVVEILTPGGEKIGVGLAKYDANKLSEYLGRKDMPEFIHYDHLHIF
ncbi:glutamate 5-kinase [Legionella micdadei]|uniref:Glutamate 5-kinase n=1 Tax=Legionella micdadei TaxID=451 RepID=A0A098GIK8_LEGMI|nr:glutamate 5-kinase [Legionella micdadei]ARG98721.1 glutamate 5-kinase [Legionella micdadei]ARH01440.1 glutamate 5-kinase [Legionella micdadei]KTD28938.1 glutamate 5-kinase [Legionella micdadei]CEG62319.1 Glutamate 5-kinase [Legionella micdadei]SCY03687.1 glutamate 5-kinase [Legionella micdadei]